MTDEAIAVAGPVDLELVALTPTDMATAQADLIAWCSAKIARVSSELRGVAENLRVAKASKWRSSGLQRQQASIKKRVEFYKKIAEALKAGYLIVPNFPVDIFAVRTSRFAPVGDSHQARWVPDQKAELLPAGEGRYVSQRPIATQGASDEITRHDGKKEMRENWYAGGFKDPEFPVSLVRPVIMEATQKAMALNVFDQLGVIQHQRKRDPIIVGQIIDPRDRYRNRLVTFFVAWWLNTETL